MYVRTQSFGSTDAELRFLQRNGVRHEGFGIALDMSSIPIYEKLPNIIYYGNTGMRRPGCVRQRQRLPT